MYRLNRPMSIILVIVMIISTFPVVSGVSPPVYSFSCDHVCIAGVCNPCVYVCKGHEPTGGEPGKPGEPGGPQIPVVPVDPTEPAEPTEPTEPTEPKEPVYLECGVCLPPECQCIKPCQPDCDCETCTPYGDEELLFTPSTTHGMDFITAPMSSGILYVDGGGGGGGADLGSVIPRFGGGGGAYVEFTGTGQRFYGGSGGGWGIPDPHKGQDGSVGGGSGNFPGGSGGQFSPGQGPPGGLPTPPVGTPTITSPSLNATVTVVKGLGGGDPGGHGGDAVVNVTGDVDINMLQLMSGGQGTGTHSTPGPPPVSRGAAIGGNANFTAGTNNKVDINQIVLSQPTGTFSGSVNFTVGTLVSQATYRLRITGNPTIAITRYEFNIENRPAGIVDPVLRVTGETDHHAPGRMVDLGMGALNFTHFTLTGPCANLPMGAEIALMNNVTGSIIPGTQVRTRCQYLFNIFVRDNLLIARVADLPPRTVTVEEQDKDTTLWSYNYANRYTGIGTTTFKVLAPNLPEGWYPVELGPSATLIPAGIEIDDPARGSNWIYIRDGEGILTIKYTPRNPTPSPNPQRAAPWSPLPSDEEDGWFLTIRIDDTTPSGIGSNEFELIVTRSPELLVSYDQHGWDYRVGNTRLVFHGDGEYRVSMREQFGRLLYQTDNTIIITSEARVRAIYLDRVRIDCSRLDFNLNTDFPAAINVINSNLDLGFVGDNFLTGKAAGFGILQRSGAGIQAAEGSTLRITDFTPGGLTGSITARAGRIVLPNLNGSAGIGGSANQNAGTITIESGNIHAFGSGGGAGIGGGHGGAGGNITITGGSIIAGGDTIGDGTGGGGGAGIGGGFGRDSGKITISFSARVRAMGGGGSTGGARGGGAGIGGGQNGKVSTVSGVGSDGNPAAAITIDTFNDVTAIGGPGGGAGIGSGSIDAPSTGIGGGVIRIEMGDVRAYGTEGGAAIGGGRGSANGTVRITGGDVTADNSGSPGGAGIGGGRSGASAANRGNGGNIIINGQSAGVNAVGGRNAAGIGGGEGGDSGEITINNSDSFKGITATGGTGGAGIGGGAPRIIGASGGISESIIITGGRVTANGGTNGAGIGGGQDGVNNEIRIEGGMVTANGNLGGAGIGGGARVNGNLGGNGGRITIDGDGIAVTSVTANGDPTGRGAGIGGGSGGIGGMITINGLNADVTARGGGTAIAGAAGIGGGNNGNGGTITINNGTVTATGGGGSAGIGGGNSGNSGTITINKGTVTATGGRYIIPFPISGTTPPVSRPIFIGGAGIGSGASSTGGTVNINGGEITANGGSGGAGIGGGFFSNGGTITISGGSIKAKGAQTTIWERTGGIDGSTIAGAAGIGGGVQGAASADHVAGTSNAAITIRNGHITADGGHGGAGIGGGFNGNNALSRIIIINGSIIAGAALVDGGGAGIGGGARQNGGWISVNGGTIEAYGNDGGAGIGGGRGGDGNVLGRDITISGGTIDAEGRLGGAGIGGGARDNNRGGNGGHIIIENGTVNATGRLGGAGIGGGQYGDGGTIRIDNGRIIGNGNGGAGIGGGARDTINNHGGNGGTITINNGFVRTNGNGGSAGIGGGHSGNGGTIEIRNGTIIAGGGDGGAGIGGGNGGSSGNITIREINRNIKTMITARGSLVSGYTGTIVPGGAGIGGGNKGNFNVIRINGGEIEARGGGGGAGIGGGAEGSAATTPVVGNILITSGLISAFAGNDFTDALGRGQGTTGNRVIVTDEREATATEQRGAHWNYIHDDTIINYSIGTVVVGTGVYRNNEKHQYSFVWLQDKNLYGDITRIYGVTPPETGELPNYTINPESWKIVVGGTESIISAKDGKFVWEAGRFVGTTWIPDLVNFDEEGRFKPDTVYRAIITLDVTGPEPQFPLRGVNANFYKVVGALETFNDARKHIVYGVFKKTDATFSQSIIPGALFPIAGNIPLRKYDGLLETDEFTYTVLWDPLIYETFETGRYYTAEITITPKDGFTIWGVPKNFFKVPGAMEVTNERNSVLVTVRFPMTGQDRTPSVRGIEIVPNRFRLHTGWTQTLDVNFTPKDAYNRNIIWTSDNIRVARVNSDGVVTALSPGSAIIGATSVDGGHKAFSTIVVVDSAKFEINSSYVLLRSGREFNLVVRSIAKDDNDVPISVTNLIWESSNPTVATVDPKTGVVFGRRIGTAIITARNDNIEFKCRVDVWSGTSIGNAIQEVKLVQNTVTINAHSTVPVRINKKLIFPEGVITESAPLTSVAGASFSKMDNGQNHPHANHFVLNVVDEGFVEILPNPNRSLANSSISTVKTNLDIRFACGKVHTTDELTINITRSRPVIRFSAIRFNSFFPGDLIPVSATSSAGRVTNIRLGTELQHDNRLVIWSPNPGTNTGMISMKPDLRAFERPVRLSFDVEVEGFGWMTNQLVAVTVVQIRPVASLNVRSVTMRNQAVLRVDSSNKVSKIEVVRRNARDTSPDLYEASLIPGAVDGLFRITYTGGPVVDKNASLRLQVYFEGMCERAAKTTPVLVSLSVKRPPPNPTVRLSRSTVTISNHRNAMRPDADNSVIINLRPSPVDEVIEYPAWEWIALPVRNDPWGHDAGHYIWREPWGPPEDNNIRLTLNPYDVPEPGVYRFELWDTSRARRATTLTVRVVHQAPVIRLSARGSLNVIEPSSTITITPRFTHFNWSGGDVVVDTGSEFFTIIPGAITTTIPGGTIIPGNADANGVVRLGMKEDVEILPGHRYPVILEYNGVKSEVLRVTPRQGTPTMHFTNRVMLIRSNIHSEGIINVDILKPEDAELLSSATAVRINGMRNNELYTIRRIQDGNYAIGFNTAGTGMVDPRVRGGGNVRLDLDIKGGLRPASITIRVVVA